MRSRGNHCRWHVRGRRGEEAGAEVVVFCTVFACEEGSGVLGVEDVLAAVVGAEMLGDEGFPLIETEAVRIACEEEPAADKGGGHGVAAGVDVDAELAVDRDGSDGGAVIGK